jgi:hypothetical protein
MATEREVWITDVRSAMQGSPPQGISAAAGEQTIDVTSSCEPPRSFAVLTRDRRLSIRRAKEQCRRKGPHPGLETNAKSRDGSRSASAVRVTPPSHSGEPAPMGELRLLTAHTLSGGSGSPGDVEESSSPTVAPQRQSSAHTRRPASGTKRWMLLGDVARLTEQPSTKAGALRRGRRWIAPAFSATAPASSPYSS